MTKKSYEIIILLGCVWGICEATLGSVLHIIHFPYKGLILSSIGMAILGMTTKYGISTHRLVAISMIAASFKFIDCIALSIPISHPSIFRPIIAIMGLGFSAQLVGLLKNNNFWTTQKMGVFKHPQIAR